MADAAMTVLLESLSYMLESCPGLISGAEDELRLLVNEVESLRALLRDGANKPKEHLWEEELEDERWTEMERQILEVVYDAQDTIDSYLIDAAAAEHKFDLLHRRRRQVTRLVSSIVEEVQSFRRNCVEHLLKTCRMEFPNKLLIAEGPHTILEQPYQIEMANEAATFQQTISSLLGDDLISGAEEELLLLKKDVALLRVFLRNTIPWESIYLESGIRHVVGHAQDIINTYLSQVSTAKGKTHLFSSLAEAVRSVREDRVKPMLGKFRIDFAEMLLIGEGSETNIIEEPHQIKFNKIWSINEDRLVGFEDEQKTITGYLKDRSDEELSFILIIGEGGLGKTTLARQIYQSQEIQYEFPTRIWVTLSRNVNLKNAFLIILKEVTSKDMSNMSQDQLALVVHEFLKTRKFLLVLDDAWDHGDLRTFQNVLPKSSRSKVLVTSRKSDLGSSIILSIEPHAMRHLTEDESWELLQLQVFGGLNICPQELIEIGQHMAKKCDGLALIVVIMGGILVDLLSKTQPISALNKAWNEVLEFMTKYYVRSKKWKSRIIGLSYCILPNELKNLFLYLGMFPEDYEIPTTTLTRLWIAEGLIQRKEGRSLEDIAEENLNQLIQRKLVIVAKVRSNGKVKSCYLHDDVHAFCDLMGKDVNLFREMQKRFDLQDLHSRLYIHSNLLNFFSSKHYLPFLCVRSFVCYHQTESLLLPENTSKIPGDAFQLLRILDIKHIRFTRFPLELTQLFCLRYIVLSSDFKILPEAISMLWNIQTLIIHTSSRTLEIKADIWKMIQLRHLQTNASIILRKEPENHSNQELQRLTNLSPDNCTNNVFDWAHCLKKLGIRGTLPVLLDGKIGSRKFDHFEKLMELENLKLLNDVHMSSPSECRLSCLPPPNKFPPKLRSLTLSATFLSWEHMSVLGMLEKLEVLKLKDNAFLGECWEVTDGSFPSLQVLQIGYTNLVSWKATRDHFPKLRSLAVRNCEKLEALPKGLEHVLSLQEIELLRPSKAVYVSVRKFQEKILQMEGNSSRIKFSIFFPPDE